MHKSAIGHVPPVLSARFHEVTVSILCNTFLTLNLRQLIHLIVSGWCGAKCMPAVKYEIYCIL